MAVAIESQSVQSSGAIDVTMRRYCSIHWFSRSDSPSVQGWKAVEMFCWAPILTASPFPKGEVNRGYLLVFTFFWRSNQGKTFLRYKVAIPGTVIIVEHW